MALVKLSEQQSAVLNWAQYGSGSLNLIARAGCGKTFTLMALVDLIAAERLGEVQILAYNKSIAEEIKEKLKKNGIDWKIASAGTVHSVGYGAWRKVAPNVAIDGKKTDLILSKIQDECSTKAINADSRETAEKLRNKAALCEFYSNFVKKAVSLAKQQAFGFLVPLSDHRAWVEMIEHYGLEDEITDGASSELGMREAINLCICVMKRGFEMDREVIDFDDMILAPLVHKAKIWPKDWVLIDEAQDTNPARRALALAMVKPRTGRLVAVGDPAQAIYGFTGASHDSMDILKQQLGSTELPLNNTYRCPKAIVSIANQWVPDITAMPEAPEGRHRSLPIVAELPGQPTFYDEKLVAGDAILCRNTKPLVGLAYTLLRRGIPCYVEGKEIGSGLVKLARRWKVKTLNALTKKLEDYRQRETQKWLAKGREEMAAGVEDKVETLTVLIEQLQSEGQTTVEALHNFVNNLFGDTDEKQKPKSVVLSTVHKSKGREWDRVYILDRENLMPSKWARKAWQMQQEYNLLYVAVTRSKRELIDIY